MVGRHYTGVGARPCARIDRDDHEARQAGPHVEHARFTKDGQLATATPEAHRDAAIAYLEEYEAVVRASRKERRTPDADAFVAWLVKEECVLLASPPGGGSGDDRTFADLPLEDAPRLYELLLDSEAVDDVFVSERELTRLLARFLARFRHRDT